MTNQEIEEKVREIAGVKEWLDHARDEMFPKIEGSALSVTILHGRPDPKLCVELGASILFDKPIVVLVSPGQVIPNNLRKVATEIVEGDLVTDRDDTALKLQAAIARVLATLPSANASSCPAESAERSANT